MGIDVTMVATGLAALATMSVITAIYAATTVRDPMAKRVKALNERREQLKAGIVASTSKRRKITNKNEAADKVRNLLSSLKMLQDEQVVKAQGKLMQAGIRSKDLAFVVIFARFVLPVAIGGFVIVGVYVLDWFPEWGDIKKYLFVAGALIGCYKAPDIWLGNKISKRSSAIRKGLPDALDLLVICAEAGLTVDRVIYHTSQPWPFPMSLMLGCHAQALTTDIVIDRAELEDARWFGRAFRADENHYQTLYRFAQSQHGQPDYVGENNRNILVLAHSLGSVVAYETLRAEGRPLSLLVPLDGSELAEEALLSAELLAQTFDSRLTLLRVVEPPVYPPYGYGYTYSYVPSSDGAELGEARLYLEDQVARLHEPLKRAETKVAVGEPARAIAETARVQQADVIVMATHGRGGLRRLILGSVATSTLRQTTVPLLLVRPSAMHQPDPDHVMHSGTGSASSDRTLDVQLSPVDLELIESGLKALAYAPGYDYGHAQAARTLAERLRESAHVDVGEPVAAR